MKAILNKPATYLGHGDETLAIEGELVEGHDVESLIANACARMEKSNESYHLRAGDGNDAEFYLVERDLSDELRAAWQLQVPIILAKREEQQQREQIEKKERNVAEQRTRLEQQIAAIESGDLLAKKKAELAALSSIASD